MNREHQIQFGAHKYAMKWGFLVEGKKGGKLELDGVPEAAGLRGEVIHLLPVSKLSASERK